MNATAEATDCCSNGHASKKMKSSNVVALSDGKINFSIDKDDYGILKQILSDCGVSEFEIGSQMQRVASIQENDKESRVTAVSVQSINDFIGEIIISIGHRETVPHRRIHFNTGNLTSVPASIGQLKSLKKLHLLCMEKLLQIPEEIGNLGNLHSLMLSRSNVTSLPPSIGKLTNLEELHLDRTRSLLRLPEEIGNLTRLKVLNLRRSAIASMPSSLGNLKNLKFLDASFLSIPDFQAKEDPSDSLLLLVQRCNILGHVVLKRGGPFDVCVIKNQSRALEYVLACNRARFRAGYKTTGKTSVPTLPSLWPLMLQKSSRLFDPYSESFVPSFPVEDWNFAPEDAIYCILSEHREFFIQTLLWYQPINAQK